MIRDTHAFYRTGRPLRADWGHRYNGLHETNWPTFDELLEATRAQRLDALAHILSGTAAVSATLPPVYRPDPGEVRRKEAE